MRFTIYATAITLYGLLYTPYFKTFSICFVFYVLHSNVMFDAYITIFISVYFLCSVCCQNGVEMYFILYNFAKAVLQHVLMCSGWRIVSFVFTCWSRLLKTMNMLQK